jgi:hypothetical protein
MNWREKSRNRLTSEHGYEILITTIQCKVRWIANSPGRQLLAVLGSKECAMEHCEQHHRESHNMTTQERTSHE